MKNLFLIYIDITQNDDQLVFNGESTYAPVINKIEAEFPESKILFSVPKTYSGLIEKLDNVIRRNDNEIADWKMTADHFDADNFVRIYADSPFVDSAIISEMLNVHTTYIAEYTYSENIPDGFCCDIISRLLIQSLPDSEDDTKSLPIQQVIKTNINQFDVELFYKEPDIRNKRLTFRTGSKREKQIIENIFNIENRIPAYSEITELINSNPEVLYTGPSYVELELTDKSSFETIYSYNSLVEKKRGEIDPGLVEKIISELDSFGLPYAISLTGSGDPLQHSSFFAILDIIAQGKELETLIIETDGTELDPGFLNYIQEHHDLPLKMIVECNGFNRETYSSVHQADLFDNVLKNIETLHTALGENLYLQIMKINETEPFLDSYYDFWENKKINIILQKQNTYLGKLKDRRYYDLTPLVRIPCWHLQRDLTIFADGSVPYCKQDLNCKFSSYNAAEIPISEIWSTRRQSFINNYKNDYPSTPDCKTCDEWFTFNL